MLNHSVMHPNGEDRMANSVDPDQTVEEQSDLGLHCLPRPIRPKTYDHYGIHFHEIYLGTWGKRFTANSDPSF